MAEVIALPGAAAAPIRNAPRRGRLPNTIARLDRARARRAIAAATDHDGAAEVRELAGWLLQHADDIDLVAPVILMRDGDRHVTVCGRRDLATAQQEFSRASVLLLRPE